jgi:hypothetical protein
MSRYPLLLVLTLAGATLAVTGMGHRQPPQPAAASPPAPTPPSTPAEAVPDPERLLDQAIDTFAPERVSWVEVKLWQQLREDASVYEVTCRYLAAPGYRVRLELHTQVGATHGELKLISDGQRLWHWQRTGRADPIIWVMELPKLQAGQPGLNTAEGVALARTETLRTQTFGGVGPMLQALRARLQKLQGKAVRWKGIDIVQVTGVWPADPSQLAAVPEYIRPRQVPRLCSIFLDARTLWPHRLEWWYSERPTDTPALLLQTEFREPILNRPLPAEEFKIPELTPHGQK